MVLDTVGVVGTSIGEAEVLVAGEVEEIALEVDSEVSEEEVSVVEELEEVGEQIDL